MRDEEKTLNSGRAELESLAQQFQSEWLAGTRPRIADYLSQATAADQAAVLARLMQVEMDLQGRSGETFAFQDYRAQFPQFAEVVEAAIAAQLAGAKDGTLGKSAASTIAAQRSERPPAAAPLEPSSRFGDYELLGEIARGGMGVVFKARQVKLNRVVAVKMILAGQLASEEDVRRFYSEAEAAAKLDHPGIVPVFEVNEIQGRHFFSMAFVEGKSLQERASRGPLPQREAALIVRQVARAVHYAHQQGVVHRDLKPRNILLATDGTPKVTDFGLAKRVDGGSDLTMSGQILGTPGYMPPEQAAGRLEAVGPHSDVYSLGGVLYCLLTGRPPFQSASVVETIKQVLETPPASPRLLNPAINRDLETVCLKCLEKDPAHRYASAAELADELDRYLDGEPIKALRIGPLRRGWRWLRRRPLVAALAGSLAVMLVVVALSIGVGQRVFTTHRVNTLHREIEAQLDAPELTAEYLQRMDGLIAALARYEPQAAAQLPARMHAALGSSIRSQIRRPKVDAQLAQTLTAAINLLAPRDAPLAAALRDDLSRRQREWQSVFHLGPPFAEAPEVLQAGQFRLEQGPRLLAAPLGTRPARRVLSSVSSEGLVQLEAQFDESWESAGRIGLSLNADAQKGYDFILQAETTSLADDADARPPLAAADKPTSLGAARLDDGYFALAIYRNGILLAKERIHQAQLPPGPLVLQATREQGELRLQARALPALAFRDPFPLAASQAGVFAIEWPMDVALLNLEARRKPRPDLNSPLEEGDEFYEKGDYAAALASYQRQALETDDPEFQQECEHKQGMCLLQLGRLDEAAARFEPLMNAASGQRWPPLAGCYLWLVRLRQRREAEADSVFDFLSTRFQFAQFASLAPQELRQEISSSYRSSLETISAVMRYNPDVVKNNQRLAAIDRFFSVDGRGDALTQVEVARAYHLLGDLTSAVQAIEPLAQDTEHSTVLRHFTRLLRLTNNAGRALTELDAFEARHPQAGLKGVTLTLERARVYAALGDWARCEELVDQIYRLHRGERPIEPRIMTYPALMKGMLLARHGAEGPAVETWRETFFDVRSLLNADGPPSSEVLNALILGSLCGEITDDECQVFFSIAMNRGGDNAFTRQAQALANPRALASAFRQMWRSPLGRRYAEAFAFETLSLRDRVKAPVVLAATEFINQSSAGGRLTREQQEAVFAAAGQLFDRTIYDGQISIAQIAQLIISWKGTTNFLGWGGVAPSLDPPLRSGVAYILAHRFLGQGNPSGALAFYDTVLKDAPPGSNLATLAAAEKRLIESKQGRLEVTSDLPQPVRMVITPAGKPPQTVEITGDAAIEVPAGEVQLALAEPHADFVLSPRSATLAAAQTLPVKLTWLWKPCPSEQALSGLLPQPATAAAGGRWQLYFRHPPHAAESLAWSGDTRQFAVAAGDGTVRIYDGPTRELRGLLAGAPGQPRDLIWAPHPHRIVAGGIDRRIVGWDAGSGRRWFDRLEHRGVMSLDWNRKATQFASAGQEGEIRIWTDAGAPLAKFQEQAGADVVAMSPDGAWIASRSWPGFALISVWETAAKTSRGLTAAGDTNFQRLAFSPDGRLLAAGNNVHLVRLWRVGDWSVVGDVNLKEVGPFDLQWAADGKTLFALVKAGEVVEITAAANPPEISRRVKLPPHSAASVSPDGTSLLLSLPTGELTLVDRAAGQARAFGIAQQAWPRIAVRPDSQKTLAVLGNYDVLRLLDGSGRVLPNEGPANPTALSDLVWNADGSRLAAARKNGSVVVCNANGGEQKTFTANVCNRSQPLAFSGDGRRVLLIGHDQRLRSIDPMAVPASEQLEGETANLSAIGRSASGLLALGTSQGRVMVEDAAGGAVTEVALPGSSEVVRLDFSPDGRTICVLQQNRVLSLCSLETGQVKPLPAANAYEGDSYGWSPGSQRLATTDAFGAVHIWSARGELLASLKMTGADRHRAVVWLDDERVATIGEGAALRIWNVDRQTVESVTLLLAGGAWARFDRAGKLLDSAGEIEQQLVYGLETPQQTVELLTPSQFAARVAATAGVDDLGPSTVPPASPAIPPPANSALPAPEERLPTARLGVIEDAELAETSGLARCAARADAVWLHNDSGVAPRLFLVSTKGQTLARYDLADAEIFDWEDIAAFRRGGEDFVLVGDIGDNGEARKSLTLYLVKEPAAASPPVEPAKLPLHEKITLQFEDGPHDCEALAVDAERNVIMLLTKELAEECWLYEAPLLAGIGETRVARRAAKLSVPLATAMDLSPDGKRLAILGGLHAFEFERREGEAWPAALARIPRRYALPALAQGEALCYRQDGLALLVISEGVKQPLWEIRLSPK